MKKSVSKRIKVTKTGKLKRRQVAVDHFRSKKTGQQLQQKKNERSIAKGYEKKFKEFLAQK
ncbi:MAG: 50S ribosomal protein L35 [Patescibacteria group bacterium]